MSGGSWDYVYNRFEDVADRLIASNIIERVALGRLIDLIASALHDIEWVDSGDYGRGDEIPAIQTALGNRADQLILDESIVRGERILKQLNAAIAKAKGES